ncbi:MAG TPA: Wadjet anti-phage system protein JetD domain-containing protein [Trueperaceae bacterium]
MSAWTTPADLRTQVERLWRSGRILSSCLSREELFPRRLTLKGPRAGEIFERFAEVRDWIANLQRECGNYRLVFSEHNNRLLGTNALPSEVWVDDTQAALRLVGKTRQAATFEQLVATTRAGQPELLAWLEKRPLEALELAPEWPSLMATVKWLRSNPRPDIYIRQIDIQGVDTKFIEKRKRVLAELFELALPPDAVDDEWRGAAGFEARYGFRRKPTRLRFRLLDPALSPLTPGVIEEGGEQADLDFTLPASVVSELRLPVERVFITENEINFLAFPEVPGSLVIFGGGYALDLLAEITWLRECEVHYWGDIDTHGFAILDRLRSYFPSTRSLLMDRETFMAHEGKWGSEKTPVNRDLPRLNTGETELYDDLRCNRLGERLRLEQELISYTVLLAALQ